MTEQKRGPNRDTTAATAGRRRAAARNRAEKAARELILTPPGAWSLEEFSDITMLGHKALEVIQQGGASAR